MDVFLEYLLQKRPTAKDTLKKVGIVLLACFVSLVIFFIFNMTVLAKFIGAYSLLLVVGAFYGAYILVRDTNLEYEYIFTNGDLDIDKIKGRKTRKRMTSLQCRGIECMAKIDDPMHKSEFEAEGMEKIDAVYDAQAGGIYGVIYQYKDKRTLLRFQPPEKLVEAMKKFNPRNVHDGSAPY